MGVSRGGRGRPGSCGQGMVSATNDQPLEQGHGCLDGPEKGGDTVPRGVELCYSASYVPHVLAMNPRAPLGTPHSLACPSLLIRGSDGSASLLGCSGGWGGL